LESAAFSIKRNYYLRITSAGSRAFFYALFVSLLTFCRSEANQALSQTLI
jgi:hypothetical protein